MLWQSTVCHVMTVHWDTECKISDHLESVKSQHHQCSILIIFSLGFLFFSQGVWTKQWNGEHQFCRLLQTFQSPWQQVRWSLEVPVGEPSGPRAMHLRRGEIGVPGNGAHHDHSNGIHLRRLYVPRGWVGNAAHFEAFDRAAGWSFCVCMCQLVVTLPNVTHYLSLFSKL